jgi:hypothetical protein
VTPQVGAYLTIVINDHRIFIVEATGCGVTFDLHMMTRGVIYAPKVVNYAPRVVSYAPRVINYAPRENYIVQAYLRSSKYFYSTCH